MTEADWVANASGVPAQECIEALACMPLVAFRRLPPPLTGGRPFGLEHTVLRRYLSGRSCNVYPSALSALYQRTAPAPVRVLFQAFVAGIPVPGDALARALGCRDLEEWLGAGLLDPAGEGRVRAPFRFICVGNAALLVDPLDQRFHNRIHLGQDSVAMCDFLAQLDPPRGRILDVGTGSGVVLINEARRGTVDAAVGVDINPRAVVMASLNARINGVTTHVSEQDIFAAGTAVGHFDRITWNAPFRFMPDTERNDNIDGFGGRLGIGLTLDFVGVLPRLLREGGEAVVMSAGPRMSDGRRPLDEELATVASRAGLDVEVHVQGMFFDARWRDFHRSHGVEGFESVILRLRAGSGRISRIGPGPAVRVVDGIRRLVHAVRQL